MLAWIAAAAMATSSSACGSVPGAKQLWARPTTHWLVIGELHGTNEMPAAFADLVCQAAHDRRKIVIALEIPQDEQASLDAYMMSNGGKDARAELTRGTFWQRSAQDGRSSVAILALLERLRSFKRAGAITEVRGLDPDSASPTEPGGRDTGMAAIVRSLGTPDGLVMAYVGNAHAMREKLERPGSSYMPAAGQLPASETVTAWVQGNGGSAWTCEQDGCSTRNDVPLRQAVRGVIAAPEGAPFDYFFELGGVTTAAIPAVTSGQ